MAWGVGLGAASALGLLACSEGAADSAAGEARGGEGAPSAAAEPENRPPGAVSAPLAAPAVSESPARAEATPVSESADGRAPEGYVEMEAAGVLSLGGRNTLGLVDADRTVLVPITIGGTEALTISLRLDEEDFARPLTHDLMDSMIAELGGEVAYVQVDEIVGGTFHASVHLHDGDELRELDARSSDAVAVGVGHDVSIFVADDVVDESGIDREELEDLSPPGQRPPLGPPDDDAIET